MENSFQINENLFIVDSLCIYNLSSNNSIRLRDKRNDKNDNLSSNQKLELFCIYFKDVHSFSFHLKSFNSIKFTFRIFFVFLAFYIYLYAVHLVYAVHLPLFSSLLPFYAWINIIFYAFSLVLSMDLSKSPNNNRATIIFANGCLTTIHNMKYCRSVSLAWMRHKL